MPIASPGFNTRRISYKLDRSARVDIALFVCALFLQRFTLYFPGGNYSVVSLSIAPAVLIFLHQFVSGRLVIQYDRLLWFLLLTLAVTSSLLLNFNGSSPNSYGLFLVIYSFLTLRRPSTTDQYRETLKGFQFLMLILCSLAIMQFPAQFIVNPSTLLMFFWIFPDSLLPYKAGVNTLGIVGAAGLIKANGIFLGESSILSQLAAFAILIEILEFRRPRYLIVLPIGFLLAYGGTGVSILLISLPLAFIHNRRVQLPLLLVGLFAAGLFATGVIHLSAFTSRLGEFQETGTGAVGTGASGFVRFVSPFWELADYLRTASLTQLLWGNGPGYGGIHTTVFYEKSSNTWFKFFLEYGLVGSFIFTCFLGTCFRRSRCPMPLIVGIVYNYLFAGNSLLDPSTLIIIAVLCTLNGPEPALAPPGKLTPTRSTSAIASSAR
jgi:hypothetical protein